MPLAAIDDEFVLAGIVGRVDEIIERQEGVRGPHRARQRDGRQRSRAAPQHAVRQHLAARDVVLEDVAFPGELALLRRTTPWPCRLAAAGRRRRAGRPPRRSSRRACRRGGSRCWRRASRRAASTIKDDHELADQAYRRSPRASRRSPQRSRTGGPATCRASPAISTSCAGRIAVARTVGIDTVGCAPMIVGLSSFHRLVREHPDLAFLAHRAWQGGAASPRASPRQVVPHVLGADALVFQPWRPLRLLARPAGRWRAARSRERDGLLPSVPVPAGGMTIDRVGEMPVLRSRGHVADRRRAARGARPSPRAPPPSSSRSAEASVQMIKPGARQWRAVHPPQGEGLPLGGVEAAPTRRTAARCSRSITVRCCSLIDLAGAALHEVAGRFSTLRRHEHCALVPILRGRGDCLVGDEVKPVETRDLVTVPAMTWHQFRATPGRGRSAFSAWSTPAATSRSCPRPRTWPARAPCIRIAAFLRSQPGS